MFPDRPDRKQMYRRIVPRWQILLLWVFGQKEYIEIALKRERAINEVEYKSAIDDWLERTATSFIKTDTNSSDSPSSQSFVADEMTSFSISIK